MTQREVAVSEVRRCPGEVIRRVACANERTILLRHGRPVAVIVSLADLAVLEAAPDLYAAVRAAVLVAPGWREMAHKAMDECRVTRQSGAEESRKEGGTPPNELPLNLFTSAPDSPATRLNNGGPDAH